MIKLLLALLKEQGTETERSKCILNKYGIISTKSDSECIMLNVLNYLKERRISTLSPEQLGARLVLAVTLVHLELFLLLTHKCALKHVMLYHIM